MFRGILVFWIGCMLSPGCAGVGEPSTRGGTESRSQAIAHLFGSPTAGTCRRGFAPVTGMERICFRTCRIDADCPAGASCDSITTLGPRRFCYVHL